MEHYFKGKTVLVTGAGWGIGADIALLCASYGARVVVSDTSRKGGKDIVSKIKSQKGYATYIKTDVSSATACEKLIKRTIAIYGSIDIACNNSAIFSELLHPADKDQGTFDNGMGLNLNGLHNCMQYEIEAMRMQGGGIIVNTPSIIGTIGLVSLRQYRHYVAAKYGMAEILQNIAGPFPARGIHINTISPAFINTALLRATSTTEMGKRVKLSPVDRLGRAQEVAGIVLWLGSQERQFLPTFCKDNN